MPHLRRSGQKVHSSAVAADAAVALDLEFPVAVAVVAVAVAAAAWSGLLFCPHRRKNLEVLAER